MEQTTPKGASFLKVTGILMIIGGGISLIVAIAALLGIAALAVLGASSGLLYVAGVLRLPVRLLNLSPALSASSTPSGPKKQVCAWLGVLSSRFCVLPAVFSRLSAAAISPCSRSFSVLFSLCCLSSVQRRISRADLSHGRQLAAAHSLVMEEQNEEEYCIVACS